MGSSSVAIPPMGGYLSRVSGSRVTGTMVEPLDIEAVFAEELDRAIDAEIATTGFPVDEWFPAGPRGGHDRTWWLANGPQAVRNFTTWYDSNPDVHVWITPDGEPAIELELIVEFGEIPVRMFIDLVLEIGSALVVVDLKSGGKQPESLSQLGIYACGLELAYGLDYRPRYGTYYMLRGVGRDPENKTYFLQPVELTGYEHSVEWWTVQFELLDQAIRQGIFVAHPQESCKRCPVAYACPAVGGDQAFRFDPSLPRKAIS